MPWYDCVFVSSDGGGISGGIIVGAECGENNTQDEEVDEVIDRFRLYVCLGKVLRVCIYIWKGNYYILKAHGYK